MKNKKKWVPLVVLITIAVAMLAFDLVSKYLINDFLIAEGDSAAFLPGFIGFVKVFNSGAGYGIFEGQQIFLIVVTCLLIVAFMSWYIYKFVKTDKMSITLSVALGFILGGALGNLYDRIGFGYVRDFLNFEFINFPVFNIADVALTVGIAILIVYLLFVYPKTNKAAKENKTKE